MNLFYFKINFLLLIFSMSTVSCASYVTCKKKKKDDIAFVIASSEIDKVVLLNSKKEVAREIHADNTYDAWKLENGNVLYAWHYGVRMVTPADSLCFNYETKSEIFACQPIDNNNILIGDCTKGRLLEMNLKGDVIKEIPLTFTNGGHACFRGARKLKNGHYLVSHYADKTVREYNPKGAVVMEIKRPLPVYASQRLDNGNTVISDQFSMSMYDAKGKMIWEFDTKKYPQLGVYHLTGFQYLPNDEIVVCNWLGHPPYHKGIPIFKINLKKEIVWLFENAKQTYSCANVQVIQ